MASFPARHGNTPFKQCLGIVASKLGLRKRNIFSWHTIMQKSVKVDESDLTCCTVTWKVSLVTPVYSFLLCSFFRTVWKTFLIFFNNGKKKQYGVVYFLHRNSNFNLQLLHYILLQWGPYETSYWRNKWWLFSISNKTGRRSWKVITCYCLYEMLPTIIFTPRDRTC